MKYTKDHEWVRIEGDIAIIGITEHAQEQLGDVVFVDGPQIGTALSAGAIAGVVESVKAASDIYAPLAGEVCAVNDALGDDPALLNRAAESDGWLFKLKNFNKGEYDALLSADDYKAIC